MREEGKLALVSTSWLLILLSGSGVADLECGALLLLLLLPDTGERLSQPDNVVPSELRCLE